MAYVLGYLSMVFAVTLLVVFTFGMDMTLKDRIIMVIGTMVFMSLLTVGAYLVVGFA